MQQIQIYSSFTPPGVKVATSSLPTQQEVYTQLKALTAWLRVLAVEAGKDGNTRLADTLLRIADQDRRVITSVRCARTGQRFPLPRMWNLYEVVANVDAMLADPMTWVTALPVSRAYTLTSGGREQVGQCA